MTSFIDLRRTLHLADLAHPRFGLNQEGLEFLRIPPQQATWEALEAYLSPEEVRRMNRLVNKAFKHRIPSPDRPLPEIKRKRRPS